MFGALGSMFGGAARGVMPPTIGAPTSMMGTLFQNALKRKRAMLGVPEAPMPFQPPQPPQMPGIGGDMGMTNGTDMGMGGTGYSHVLPWHGTGGEMPLDGGVNMKSPAGGLLSPFLRSTMQNRNNPMMRLFGGM